MRLRLFKLPRLAAAFVVAAILSGAVFWLAHLGWAAPDHAVDSSWGIAAFALVLISSLYWHARSGRRLTLASRLLLGFSFSLLILLSGNWYLAAVFGFAFTALLVGIVQRHLTPPVRLAVAGAMQFAALWAIYLAGAVWKWPMFWLLVLTYASAYISASWLLDGYEERARRLLATAWGLIAGEFAFVFSIWLVNYIIKVVVLPQAALVISAIGYVFAGIYLAHKDSKLGRFRLAEYLLIGLLLIVIVAVGTKWSGSL